MVDTLLGKTVDWIDQGVGFIMKYSDLFIWGVVAMMVAKVAKFNVKIGK